MASQLPNQGSNPHPLCWKVKSLNHWTTSEVPQKLLSFREEFWLAFFFFLLFSKANLVIYNLPVPFDVTGPSALKGILLLNEQQKEFRDY